MISYLAGLLLFVIILYLAVIFESTSMVLLGITEALLLVLSFVFLMTGSRNMVAMIEIPISVVDKNKAFSVDLRIRDKKRSGYAKVRILVEYKNALEKRGKRKWLTAGQVHPGESVYRYEAVITTPGNYEFAIRKMRLYDMFGIFFMERRMEGETNAMVLPDIHDIPVSLGEGVRNYYRDSDKYDEFRPGYDPSETFEIREFRDGDKLPGVHWKLSAKLDRLMVRERSFPKACPVVLFLNSDTMRDHHMLEWTASLSFSLMDAHCPHYAVWQSRSRKDLVRIRVDDEESYYMFMVNYLADRSTEYMSDMIVKYREKYRVLAEPHEFLFEKGQILHNGRLLELSKETELILS